MNFAERHAEWLAQLTPEQQAEKAARYEAFKAEAAALEIKIEAMRATRGAAVAKMATASSLTPGLVMPSPESVGLQENMLLWTRLYYDPAVNDYGGGDV